MTELKRWRSKKGVYLMARLRYCSVGNLMTHVKIEVKFNSKKKLWRIFTGAPEMGSPTQ